METHGQWQLSNSLTDSQAGSVRIAGGTGGLIPPLLELTPTVSYEQNLTPHFQAPQPHKFLGRCQPDPYFIWYNSGNASGSNESTVSAERQYITQRGISIFDWYSTSEHIRSDESITYNQKQDCNCWKFGKHRRHSDLANNSTFTSHASVTLVHHRISTRSCQTPYRGQHSISIISTIPSKVHIHFYSSLD